MRVPILIASLLLAAPAFAQDAAPTPTPAGAVLTLPDAINLGLAHAFGARIAAFREEAAAERVGAARTAFLPDLTLNVDDSAYQQHINPDYVNAAALRALNQGRSQVWNSTPNGTVDARYTLLSSTRRLDLEAARLSREAQSAANETARRQVVRDVARAYLQVVQADALLKLAEEDVLRRKHGLDEAHALVSAGKRADFEVIRAEADLASAEATHVQRKNDVRLSRQTLSEVCGSPLPLDFTAQTPEPPSDPRGSGVGPGIPSSTVDDVLKKRPEVRGAAADAASAKVSWQRDNRRFVPTLQLFADYNRILTPRPIDAYDQTLSYGGQLTVRFSDMTANWYRTRASRSEARLAQVTADQTRVSVSLDVERAALEADRAAEVLAASKKASDAARRNYEVAEERYRLGVATQTERIDAEASLVEAEANAARADVDYRTTLWNLRYEMGEPLEAR